MCARRSLAPVIVASVLSFASPAAGQQPDSSYARLIGRQAEYVIRDKQVHFGRILWMDRDSLVIEAAFFQPSPVWNRTQRIALRDVTRLRVRGGPEGKGKWEQVIPTDSPVLSSEFPRLDQWIRFRLGDGTLQEGRVVGVGAESIVIAPRWHGADPITVSRSQLSEVWLGASRWRASPLAIGVVVASGALLAAQGASAGDRNDAAVGAAIGVLVGAWVARFLPRQEYHGDWRRVEPPFTVTAASVRDEGIALTVRMAP